MNVKDETIFYFATIIFSCFMGAMISELYDSHEDNEPINVSRVIIGGTTGSVLHIGLSSMEAATFNKVLVIGFLIGASGVKILEMIKGISPKEVLNILFNGGTKALLDYLQKQHEEEEGKDNKNK